MRSTNPIYEEDTEDKTIRKIGEVTKPVFMGIQKWSHQGRYVQIKLEDSK